MAGLGVSYRSPLNPGAPPINTYGGAGINVAGRNMGRAASAPPPVDYSAILKQFGNSGGSTPGAHGVVQGGPAAALAASSAAMAGAPTPSMTNTSTPNPTITAINAKQLERANGDMNVGALTRASDISIRDNAENERKAANERLAGRGVSGAGLEDAVQGGITRDTLRMQTGAGVAIKNDAEARRDSLYGQIAGQAATDENLQNQQRNTGINQQQVNFQEADRSREAELSLFRNALDLFGNGNTGVYA